MKKLTILLLALALTAFAVPAMAGDVAVNGTYQFDAESYSGQGDVKRAWYDDELRVNISVTQGAVKAFVGLEVSDDAYFDGAGNERSGETGAISGTNGNALTGTWAHTHSFTGTYNDIVNDYYVQWATPVEGLSVKIGEYALDFGRKVVIYQDPAAHHIAFAYNKLANVDLTFALGKMIEAYDNDDNDTDAMSLLANVKGVALFKKLDFLYVTVDAKAADAKLGYMGIDTAFAAGPLDLAIEYGSISNEIDEADEGSFLYAELGFDRIAGFDINLEVFDSNAEAGGSLEGTFGTNFFFPYQLVGFDSGVAPDLTGITLIGVSGSYKLSDKMTVAGKILAQGTVKEDFSVTGDADPVGMEIDARLMYKFADNASVQLTYATWSPGDGVMADGDTENAMRARFDFSF